MDSFQNLVWSLEVLLSKHPEIHYIRPKSYTELDLREVAFIIGDAIRGEVVVSEDLTTWIDKFSFYQLGAGRSYEC